MNNETKIIEDNAVRIALYNDLKGLHRMATSFKAFVVSHNIEEAMLDYCGITVREFCEDKRADELTKEREANSEVDADKFIKDHFVFTTVKM